jgi:hypothetical protein
MAGVRTAPTMARSNAESDTTELKNRAPSGRGGGHPLPVVGAVLGSMVGAAVGSMVPAAAPGVPPTRVQLDPAESHEKSQSRGGRRVLPPDIQ